MRSERSLTFVWMFRGVFERWLAANMSEREGSHEVYGKKRKFKSSLFSMPKHHIYSSIFFFSL